MRQIHLPLLALVLSACTVGTSPSTEPLEESAASLTSDAGDALAWTDLAFEGGDCAELSPPTTATNGADASFLLGLGAHVAAHTRSERRCAVRATLLVPPGHYVTSLQLTLGYGGVKPVGARFAIDADAHLHTPRGRFDVEVSEPAHVDFDQAFADASIVRDVSASREELCESRRPSRVPFASRVDLRYAAADKDGVLDVDSIDVHADLAPCPPHHHR